MRNRKVTRDLEGWRTVSRKALFENDHMQISEERVKSPSSIKSVSWTVVHRKTSTVIAPRTDAGKFLLIKQERIPVRQTFWEFPAGQIDGAHSPSEEAVREAALRELREESGWQLSARGKLTPLGMFYSSPGFTSEHAWLYMATPVEPAPEGAQHDASESILEARLFSGSALRRMIATGEIRDANTLAIFARLSARKLI